jgi:hypothetical protein
MTTTTQTLWQTPGIKLPDGHRIFQAVKPIPIRRPEFDRVPMALVLSPRGLWALADDSGDYPEDTDDGILWLDFSRDLAAGQSITDGSDGVTPTIPLLESSGNRVSTITDTRTLLWLALRFDWRIRCGHKIMGVIER